jgi:hypothetical protein
LPRSRSRKEWSNERQPDPPSTTAHRGRGACDNRPPDCRLKEAPSSRRWGLLRAPAAPAPPNGVRRRGCRLPGQKPKAGRASADAKKPDQPLGLIGLRVKLLDGRFRLFARLHERLVRWGRFGRW